MDRGLVTLIGMSIAYVASLLGMLLALPVPVVLARSGDGAYDALPPAKAMAAPTGRPEATATISHSQPHDIAAALQAVKGCQGQYPDAAPCELVRLNDERITTGREILARVPATPHPLYLWEYRQQASTVFLAGSVHVLKPSLYPLPRQLSAAFAQADYLVLEVNTEQYPRAVMQQRTMAHALLPADQTLTDLLPAPLAQRLDRSLAAHGMSFTALAGAKPAMVMTQLTIARLMALGYLPEYGVEQHFLGLRTRQEVLELETLDAQLALLFDQPLSMQVQLLADTLDLEPVVEPLLADLLVAWLSGDDASFLDLFKAQAGDSVLSEEFNRALLDDRNPAMAKKILGYLQQSGTYFVLVGAAHLVGERGVVSLLADAGVEGRRIQSSEPL